MSYPAANIAQLPNESQSKLDESKLPILVVSKSLYQSRLSSLFGSLELVLVVEVEVDVDVDEKFKVYEKLRTVRFPDLVEWEGVSVFPGRL